MCQSLHVTTSKGINCYFVHLHSAKVHHLEEKFDFSVKSWHLVVCDIVVYTAVCMLVVCCVVDNCQLHEVLS